MSIFIELLHGRHTPDEELEDWGFDGPVLGPFPWFHMTYGGDVNLGDQGLIVMGKQVEFPVPDAKEGLIHFLGAYYGDMSIMSSRSSSNMLDKRWNETFHALMFSMEDLPMHLNDPVEWIKIYAQYALRGY